MDVTNQSQEQHSSERGGRTARKIVIGTYLLLALACLAVYGLLRFQVFEVFGKYRPLLNKLLLAGACSFVVLTVAKYVEGVVGRHTHTKAVAYNLVRLVRLLSFVVVALVFISFLFQNWYTAAVSLGLISLILGFALQTPISSFIGWLYIILRNPYRVGDRIQIEEFRGDVVEIGYLDTTLWEFGGDYMTSDLPTGRLIRFPNSLALSSAVFNYSWRDFPYVWNEIPFHVAYESDFDYIAATVRRVANEELGEGLKEHVEYLKGLIASSPVDELTIKEYPFVTLRTNTNTWLEATLVYLVLPRQAAAMRTRILSRAVKELLKEPGKVMFPNGNNR